MSEFEVIKLNDVFEMNSMNFLNDLSYLKAKEAHDKTLNARNTE